MKVGDIVRVGDSMGIVLDREYVKAGQYWVVCLWSDGVVEGCAEADLEVISETK